MVVFKLDVYYNCHFYIISLAVNMPGQVQYSDDDMQQLTLETRILNTSTGHDLILNYRRLSSYNYTVIQLYIEDTLADSSSWFYYSKFDALAFKECILINASDEEYSLPSFWFRILWEMTKFHDYFSTAWLINTSIFTSARDYATNSYFVKPIKICIQCWYLKIC